MFYDKARGYLMLVGLCLCVVPDLHAQPGAMSGHPEKVHRVVYQQMPRVWYETQAKLWEARVNKNPEDPEAWLNYYYAVEYANAADSKERLATILKRMADNVPESFEYLLLRHRNLDDIDALQKAYRLQPDNPETYYSLIVHYKTSGAEEQATEMLQLLYDSRDIATGLLNYNYNMLMSTEAGALLFTNGDNDTFPIWLLQDIKHVRPDVTVLNAHLCFRNRDYLHGLLAKTNIAIKPGDLKFDTIAEMVRQLCDYMNARYPQRPVYLSLTMDSRYVEPIQGQLYLVGLTYLSKDSPKVNNLALLKKNLESRFRLDYLRDDWYDEHFMATEGVVSNLNNNYVTPFLMLSEHYDLSGDAGRAKYWKEFARSIAERSGNGDLIGLIDER